MATQEASFTREPAPAKHHVAHPLNPLTTSEISATAALIRSAWPSHTDLRFKTITLLEPAKKDFLPYLDAEHNGKPLPSISRKAFTAYYIRNTVGDTAVALSLTLTGQDRFHEAVVNISDSKIETNVRLGPNAHGNADYDEVKMVEINALEDEGVKAAIAKLELPQGTIVCADPWIYGMQFTCLFPTR